MADRLLYDDDDEGLLDRARLVPPPRDPRLDGVAPWSTLPAMPNQQEAWTAAPLRATTWDEITQQQRERLRGVPNPIYEQDRTSQIVQDALLGPAGAWGASVVQRAPGAVRGLLSADDLRPVFPQPQRMMPEGERVPGGRYLESPTRDPATGGMTGADITGQTRAGGRIEIGPNGAPRMAVSPQAATPTVAGQGNVVRSNLFRREAGWDWVGAPPPGVAPDARFLVSVQPTSGQHVYALSTDFEGPVSMARYPRAQSEPRLRPTTHGDVELGNEVGRISVRGVEHPVYDRVFVFSRPPAEPHISRRRP